MVACVYSSVHQQEMMTFFPSNLKINHTPSNLIMLSSHKQELLAMMMLPLLNLRPALDLFQVDHIPKGGMPGTSGVLPLRRRAEIFWSLSCETHGLFRDQFRTSNARTTLFATNRIIGVIRCKYTEGGGTSASWQRTFSTERRPKRC